jgi:hypothetical protein
MTALITTSNGGEEDERPESFLFMCVVAWAAFLSDFSANSFSRPLIVIDWLKPREAFNFLDVSVSLLAVGLTQMIFAFLLTKLLAVVDNC